MERGCSLPPVVVAIPFESNLGSSPGAYGTCMCQNIILIHYNNLLLLATVTVKLTILASEITLWLWLADCSSC